MVGRKRRFRVTGAETIAIYVIVAVVAVAAVGGQGIFSPGPLSGVTAIPAAVLGGVTSHAELSGQCSSCHPAPWQAGSMGDLCLTCHDSVAKQLTDPHELHSLAVRSSSTLTCTAGCHTEHNGAASLTLVKAEHFARSSGEGGVLPFSMKAHAFRSPGVPFTCVDCHPDGLQEFSVTTCFTCHEGIDAPASRVHAEAFGLDCLKCHDGLDTYGKAFDHNTVAFPLLGKHGTSDTTCAKCHQDARTVADLQAAPRDCYQCHQRDDKHRGTLATDCATCHNAVAWRDVAYDHSRARYVLTGKHLDVSCVECHANNLYKETPQDCNACHVRDDKHNGVFGQDCAQCHTAADWKVINFSHSATVYPLTGRHATAACTACHTGGALKSTPRDCISCHARDDTHKGALGSGCVQCHTTGAWKPSTFNHASTSLALTGAHSATACTACHTNGIYRGTPKDCYSCHKSDDTHKGAYGASCITCHNTSAWKPSTFNHANTAFALTGAHSATACTACHINGIYRGTPKDCYSCHKSDDTHKGVNGTACASCHSTSAWKPATVNHALTAFPLTGAHTAAACATCHVNGVYKGTAKDCYSCHVTDDTHKGTNGTGCASCHSTTGWKPAAVNHALTAFPLTGAHTAAACATCHVNGVYNGTAKDCNSCHAGNDTHKGTNGTACASCHTTSAWKPATVNHALTAFPLTGKHVTVTCPLCHVNGVYKGTARDCYSCHKAKDIHAGSQGTNCASCHTTTGWPTTTINHALTAFPLTGAHTTAACATCHVNGVYKGTAKDCYSCHVSDDTHKGTNGTGCASCHSTTGWKPATVNHALTAFPLTGKHATVTCALCHVNGVYKGTPVDCYSCHKAKDIHLGSLGTNCASCHATTGWPTTTINHALTAFPLTGRHTTVACASCHAGGVYKGTARDCYSCHKSDDDHNGRNGTNCARCHTTSGW